MTNRAMQRCRLVQLRLEPLEPRTVPAFLPGVHYFGGNFPGEPDVADFNLDGRLDVAVPTCLYGQVSVLLGNGDGTLQPRMVFDLNAGCTESVKTADMNIDGFPDIVAANIGSKHLSVLLGIGDGSFRKPIVSNMPEETSDLVVGDFNTDGIQDAAAVDPQDHRVYVMTGEGNGRLTHTSTLTAGQFPVHITASDFNNDGKIDLATANQLGNSMSVFLGNGDGTFKSKTDLATGFVYANGISASDFNNDGHADVVVSNGVSNTISVFSGKGDGTFFSPIGYRVRRGPTGSTVGDFNRDGYMDIAVSCQGPEPAPSAVTVLLNNQLGGFVTYAVYAIPTTLLLVAGDLNDDTYVDIIAQDFSGVTVLLNDAQWAPPSPIEGTHAKTENQQFAEANRIENAVSYDAQAKPTSRILGSSRNKSQRCVFELCVNDVKDANG